MHETGSTLLLERISQELEAVHGAHTILLYGSHADGSAGPGSDCDVAAFAPVAEMRRLARLEQGIYLDAFVYPDSVLEHPDAEHLRLRGSKIVRQRGTQADAFLHRLDAIHAQGPAPLAADEIAARKAWAHKMAERVQRGDAEGNYRRAWLLQALLEDYFHLRGAWYEGPKKSLRWLERHDPLAYQAFCTALVPASGHDAITALVAVVAAWQRPVVTAHAAVVASPGP